MIAPADAEHAELGECFCGHVLIFAAKTVCSQCLLVPKECKCPEVPESDGK